jgi:L-asparagine transporter-like permease
MAATMFTRRARPRHPVQAMGCWVLYCLGVCLELLGIAFMGAVVVVFFGQVDARVLLSLTAVGMLFFYSGWFCVRQGSRHSHTVDRQPSEEGDDDARRARTGDSEAASSPR